MYLYITIAFGCLVIIPNDVTSEPDFSLFPEKSKQVNNDVQFHAYTTTNPSQSYILEYRSDRSLANSPLNSKWQTIFFVHGFGESETSISAQEIKNAYLQHGPYNIIVVSWSKLAALPWYLNAVDNLSTVGSYTGQLIEWLENKRVISIPNLHVIGFSLGAHVCSHISKELAKNRRSKIGRITGLEPAGPAFEKFSITKNLLTNADATFVDIIHTNPEILGIQSAIGHADFYVNYGKTQPGCGVLDLDCSHGRAWRYYVESISYPYGFPGSKCVTWSPTVSNCVQSNNVFMGFAINRQTRGIYYVETNSQSPFAKKSGPPRYQKNMNAIQYSPFKKNKIGFYSTVDKSSFKLDKYHHYYR